MCGHFSASLLSVVTYKSNAVSKHNSEVFYCEFSRYKYQRDRCYSNLKMYWVELMFKYNMICQNYMQCNFIVLYILCSVTFNRNYYLSIRYMY